MEEQSRDMLEQCKLVSPDIYRYFEDKLYLEAVENPENITPSFLIDLAVHLLLNELENDFGIETNLEVEDILVYHPFFEIIITLRKKFDKDALAKALTELDECSLERVQFIIEDAVCGEDVFIGLIQFFQDLLPLDQGWALLDSVLLQYHFEGTSNFAQYFQILWKSRLSQDINRTYIDDDNFQNIVAFTNNMQERDDRVSLMVNELIAVYPDINQGRLQELIKKYDKDKLAPEYLPFFAAWYALKDKPKEEPPFLAHHHATVYHHLQYWQNPINQGKKLTKEQAVMVVASMVLDGWDSKKRVEEVKAFFPYCDPEVQSFLTKIANFTYSEEVSRVIPPKEED